MSINKELVDSLRRQLEAVSGAAVRALAELVEAGESESVRLAASVKVLELVGVQPAREIQVSLSEVAQVDDETRLTLERLERNIEARTQNELPKAQPEIETLFVLEGDSDELPVGGPIADHIVIETRVSQ